MKEIRVYAINDSHRDEYEEKIVSDLTNDEFMDVSETQGLVWTLPSFSDDFNNGDVSDEWYIRFIEVETPFEEIENSTQCNS